MPWRTTVTRGQPPPNDAGVEPVSYAIMRSGGKQFRAEPEGRIRVPRIDASEGAEIEIDDVLLYSSGDDRRVGAPTLEGVKVRAKVLEHGLGKKVMVEKFKRRKNYHRTVGHRQPFTLIEVIGIDA